MSTSKNMERIKRPPKTIKEKKFVKEYLKSGNATEAAARVYDVSTRDVARNIGAQNVAKLSIVDIMEKRGLTDEKIAETLKDAMEANKPISAVSGRDAGEASMDFIDVPDGQARLKATELASKIKGHLKDKVEHSGQVGVIPLLQNVRSNERPTQAIESETKD